MADERRQETVEASPEEARFLRRFVRRTVLPWIVGVGALAGLSLGVALSPHPPAALVAAESGVADKSAALDELRAELASLRDSLAALRSARSVESQLPGDFEPRLAKLEATLATWPPPASREAAGAPATESPGDLASIRDRLYDLETSQDRKQQERAALQQDALVRLYELERSVQSEAAARVGNLQTCEQRIERLELRLSTLEALPTAPASPVP